MKIDLNTIHHNSGRIHWTKMITALVIFFTLSHLPLNILDSYFKDWSFHFKLSMGLHTTMFMNTETVNLYKEGGGSSSQLQMVVFGHKCKKYENMPTNKVRYKASWFQIEMKICGGSSPWFRLFGRNSSQDFTMDTWFYHLLAIAGVTPVQLQYRCNTADHYFVSVSLPFMFCIHYLRDTKLWRKL